MKLPKDFDLRTNGQQREWLRDRKVRLEKELEDLKILSRKLATGGRFVPKIDPTRPDLDAMRDEEGYGALAD